MSCVHCLDRRRRVPRRAKCRAWGHYRTNILEWAGKWLWICYDPRHGWIAQWFGEALRFTDLLPTRRAGDWAHEEKSAEE